jgi:prepilin peptidase CpaA
MAFALQVLALVIPLLLVAAAVSDLFTMTIPNWLTGALAAFFPVAALASGLPLADAGLHLACGAGLLVVAFGMFARGWIGGGDAKLVAASALFMGPALLLPWVVLISVLGGALTLALLGSRRFPLPLFCAQQPWIARLHAPTTGVPYGIAIAAGSLLLLPQSPIFLGLTG